MPEETAMSTYLKSFFDWESTPWVVLTLWLGFILIDIDRRFIISDDKEYLITPQSLPVLEPLFEFTKGQHDAYLERLATYSIDAVSETKLIVDGLPPDVFAKQADSAFWSYGPVGYRLLGVFDGEERFVLVASRNATDGKEIVIRLQKDETFDGHRVVGIMPESLILVASDGAQVSLSLFEELGEGG